MVEQRLWQNIAHVNSDARTNAGARADAGPEQVRFPRRATREEWLQRLRQGAELQQPGQPVLLENQSVLLDRTVIEPILEALNIWCVRSGISVYCRLSNSFVYRLAIPLRATFVMLPLMY